jgi:HD-GYP domain-containing protein (c-di-GMP phosphodiesterase class II)
MSTQNLVPVSIKLLFEGMKVPHDIYSAGTGNKLVSQGVTIYTLQIEQIGRLNRERDTILVTPETKKLMLAHRPQPKPKKAEIPAIYEFEYHYNIIVGETFDRINEIANSNVMPRDFMNAVSKKLRERLELTSPDIILEVINRPAPPDEYLQRHCVNVGFINGLIGKWMGLPKDETDILVLVGLIHDCGQVLVPAQPLNLPRKLSAAEFEIIKMHPVYADELLRDLPSGIRSGVRAHHEKHDGRGYPDGLSGIDAPLSARITAVSDFYAAMVSRRPHREAHNPFVTISRLKEMSGVELDPSVVGAFIGNMPKELLNKPFVLSNGGVGVIHRIDDEELEYPYVRYDNRVVKTSYELYCMHMYSERH